MAVIPIGTLTVLSWNNNLRHFGYLKSKTLQFAINTLSYAEQ